MQSYLEIFSKLAGQDIEPMRCLVRLQFGSVSTNKFFLADTVSANKIKLLLNPICNVETLILRPLLLHSLGQTGHFFSLLGFSSFQIKEAISCSICLPVLYFPNIAC